MKQVTLQTIADGVAEELFKREADLVATNIADQNTPALTKRKITLSFTFEPDADREEVKVIVESKSTLAPIKAFSKTAHLGKRNGKATLYAQDTKQIDMFDEDVTQFDKKQRPANA